MSFKNGRSFLWRSTLALVAYGCAYAITREISISGISATNWIPMAALRFTTLLFAPIRYWPALFLGETLAFDYQLHDCVSKYGLTWALIGGVPRMLYVFPFVYWLRKQEPDLDKHISKRLILCVFGASIVVGLYDGIAYVVSLITSPPTPDEHVIPTAMYVMRRTTGNYLTILTITPIVLWLAAGVRRALRERRFQMRTLVTALQDVQWRSTSALLALVLALTVTGNFVGPAMHFVALCGLFAALVIASWRYGWQSAALVGAAANLGVIALMPSHDDLLTIQAQGVIAAFMTFALFLGTRTQLFRTYEQVATSAEQSIEVERRNAAQARKLARRELFAMEHIRLDHAAVLDGLFSDTRQQAIKMIHSVRPSMSPKKVAAYYEAFEALHQRHQRITTSMSPMAWWQFGGEDGPIVQALGDIGIHCHILHPTLEEAPPRLSIELSPALYRLQCEAIAYLVRHAPTDDVRMHIRLHVENGRPVATTSLTSVGTPIEVSKSDYEDFLVSLGVSYVGARRLRDRAQLYDGDVEIVPNPPHRMSITAFVTDKSYRFNRSVD